MGSEIASYITYFFCLIAALVDASIGNGYFEAFFLVLAICNRLENIS